MIAIPSSSTAMMNVSRNWPSGIIGLISRDAACDDEEGTAENAENAENGFSSVPDVLGALCALCGSIRSWGIHRLGYTPPARTPGSDALIGDCATCSGRSC